MTGPQRLPILLFVLALLAGCGGGSSTPAASAPAGSTSTTATATAPPPTTTATAPPATTTTATGPTSTRTTPPTTTTTTTPTATATTPIATVPSGATKPSYPAQTCGPAAGGFVRRTAARVVPCAEARAVAAEWLRQVQAGSDPKGTITVRVGGSFACSSRFSGELGIVDCEKAKDPRGARVVFTAHP